MKKVLHVGCGLSSLEHLPDGFQDGTWEEVRLDIDPDCNPHIVGTIQDMTEVASESVDAVYSSHNLEHVHFHEVAGVLQEFKRVLNPEGFCVITCPDIKAVAKAIIEHGVDGVLYSSPAGDITANDIMYGQSSAIEQGQFYMAHKTGFDLAALLRRLEEAEFYLCCGKTHGLSLWSMAFKENRDKSLVKSMFRRFAFKEGC